jgi:uncharacterized protein (DUF2235 family)
MEYTGFTGSKRLVLCFDGTGNKFNADETDSNIVKIYEMLDRTTADQYHYYQPGIGTYVEGQYPISNGFIERLQIGWDLTKDSMFGTSFVYHVLAGYKFLLKYYAPGDKIYVFGFSRGAYTAKFLSEMIENIGLLSRGNDEMVRFAWETFSNYQSLGGKFDQSQPSDTYRRPKNHGAGRNVDERVSNSSPKKPKTKEEAQQYMEIFKSTFCRLGVKVFFLGLFDCVNSVSQFEIHKNSTPYIPRAPAHHIRHALSSQERRAKFKPALFLLDKEAKSKVGSLEERWFAGNHGDIGGGWELEKQGTQVSHFLLSDIALSWMVEEVRKVDKEVGDGLVWHEDEVKTVMQHALDQTHWWNTAHIADPTAREKQIRWIQKSVHDPLRYGGGLSWLETLQWRFQELLPFSHWDLIGERWIAKEEKWIS